MTSAIYAAAAELLDGDDDHFGDTAPIVAGERDWRYTVQDADLSAFVRDADRFQSMSVVREHDDPDLAAEATRWQLQLRAAGADVKPCSSMQRAVDKWADGSRPGQFSGALAVIRLDERGHRGLGSAVDQLWQVRAKDQRDFDKVLRDARKIVLTDPTPKDEHGCDCDARDVAILPRIGPKTAVGESTAPPGGEPADPLGSWRPVDLGPYLRREVKRPEPSVGVPRADGMRFLYPGREHTVVGEMESGKSWFALACVAYELTAGHSVVYVHFEEADASDTVERLLLLGVTPARITAGLSFIGPESPIRPVVIDELTAVPPSLVVLDGVNEGMALHGHDIMAPDGAAAFRRALVKPFTAVGAAVLGCDHVVKDREKRERGPLGSIHKGNGLSGSLIMLENVEPFGRGARGCSHVIVTKDRPGHLRRNGRPARGVPGRTLMGQLVVDDTGPYGLSLTLYAPKDDEQAAEDLPERSERDDEVMAAVAVVIAAGVVPTLRKVRAAAGGRKGDVDDALDRLVLAGRLNESRGERNARVFQPPPCPVTVPGDQQLAEPA